MSMGCLYFGEVLTPLRSPPSFRGRNYRFVCQREVTFKSSNEGEGSCCVKNGDKSVSLGLRHVLIGEKRLGPEWSQ